VNAQRRVKHLKEILDQIGLGRDRLEMYFISSSEGQRFAEVVDEMTCRIQELGPNPLRDMSVKVGSPEDMSSVSAKELEV
jgi:F420-non-reducing hydrogenase iron-sulfur subunit